MSANETYEAVIQEQEQKLTKKICVVYIIHGTFQPS